MGMRISEYEEVIGKLVLLKISLTHNHHKMIDDMIEVIASEYAERITSGDLD